MSNLLSIVYVSSATKLMTEPQLEALLIDARNFNKEHNITGILLYCDGSFMQYFEGPKEAVAEVYQRIVDSRQHKNIIKMVDGPVDARNFPDWLMGIAEPSKSEFLKLQTASWLEHVDRKDGSLGLTLLKSFWIRNRG
jgi:hypothetical protein